MPTAYSHRSVLLEPAIAALLDADFGPRRGSGGGAPPRDGVFVDGTFGRGGHSRALLARLAPGARLLAFDKDPQALAAAQALAAEDPRVTPIHDSFSKLDVWLAHCGLTAVDGILLDLGVSSPQLDQAQRGFSFMRDGPLDMRMDTARGQTAAQWLAQAPLEQIQEVIADYGEERFAFQIAKAIVARRESAPLRTTGELAELVARVVRTREKGQHPATRTFQAIRIHINDELADLAQGLALALTSLRAGGRLVVLSFHSLEDRMVKRCLAAAAHPGRAQARLPIPEKDMPAPLLVLLGRHTASEAERQENPRARSVVMRVAQRTDAPLTAARAREFVAWQPAGAAARHPRARRRP